MTSWDSASHPSDNGKSSEAASQDSGEIVVNITDAISEKDKVKFSVHTNTTLSVFQESDFTVSRQHDDFLWLHDRLSENDEYAGLIIPPSPSRPDFDASRGKGQKVNDMEGSLTKEEHEQLEDELKAEYLVLFKKTVSAHELFLQRLAAHSILRHDTYFRLFLESKEELNTRGKNAKQQISGFFKSLKKSADDAFHHGHKKTDDYFDNQRQFLVTYQSKIEDAVSAADKSTKANRNTADHYGKLSTNFNVFAPSDRSELVKYFQLLAEFLDHVRKSESRIQDDFDLKFSETLRYYMRDSKAALDLMNRRARQNAEFDTANKNLDRARQKNKDIQQAETAQQNIKSKFENISDRAKDELNDFKLRRIEMFRKNFIEMTELQIKHAKTQIQATKGVLQKLQTL